MTSADHDLPPLSDDLPPDTTVLVLAAQGGDRKALEVLFERYLPRVRRIVALRTGRRLEMLYEQEDLVQQALMRAFADLHSYEKQSQAQFRNWIARCVEHELADLARKGAAAKRGGALRAGVPPPDRVLASSIIDARQATPSALADASELEQKIETALLAMPSHFREIIILRHLCGMSYRQIADELGFEREGTARVVLSRALKKLRQSLGM